MLLPYFVVPINKLTEDTGLRQIGFGQFISANFQTRRAAMYSRAYTALQRPFIALKRFYIAFERPYNPLIGFKNICFENLKSKC